MRTLSNGQTEGLSLLPTLLTSPLNPKVTLSIQVENKASGRSISEVNSLTCKLSSDSGSCC